jgi:hypothetical protein
VELNTAAVEIIGETGLDRPVGALTFAPDGRLYGVSSVADVYSLLAIDPRNGDTTVIGPLGVTPFGLAADGAGRLWLSVDSSLYRVDPGTGAAALVADLGRPLWSLAALGTRLFVVTADGSQRLEEIDLETNQLTPLFELDTPIIFDAGFDAGGTLWLVGMGGGITINVPLYYFKVPDLDAGVLVETFQHTYHFTELEAGMLNLALPVVAPTDVPVLDVLGLSLLAALLGLLGFRRLCVQRGGGHPRRPSTLQRPARAEFKMISSRRSAASRSSSQRAPGGKGQPENRS